MPLSEYDDEIASHHLLADPARYNEIFRRLRAEDPVHMTRAKGNPPFWAVTRHADIIEIERQNERFLNAPLVFLRDDEEQRVALAETGGTGIYLRTLVNMDEPDHKKYRGLTQSWFMPQNIKRLSDIVERLAAQVVDRMAEMGDTCELTELSPWYPLAVIMTLMGVPDEDHPQMLRLAQAMLAQKDPDQHLEVDGASSSKKVIIGEFFAYFGKVLQDRRQNPRDDLASLLANAQIDGQPVGQMELLSYCLLVATAGHDTTASAVAGGVLALLQYPDQLAKLRAQPELVPSAVEEVLRWTTPVKHFIRTATQDYVLRGQQIKAGDHLMMCYPSANMDEEVFDHPERFLVERSPNRQLAFGFGVHACLGQHLSRMELKAFFNAFVRRVTRIELDGPVSLVASNQVAGPKRLPIRYEVKAAA